MAAYIHFHFFHCFDFSGYVFEWCFLCPYGLSHFKTWVIIRLFRASMCRSVACRFCLHANCPVIDTKRKPLRLLLSVFAALRAIWYFAPLSSKLHRNLAIILIGLCFGDVWCRFFSLGLGFFTTHCAQSTLLGMFASNQRIICVECVSKWARCSVWGNLIYGNADYEGLCNSNAFRIWGNLDHPFIAGNSVLLADSCILKFLVYLRVKCVIIPKKI